MKVLGIDPSPKASGFALLEVSGPHLKLLEVWVSAINRHGTGHLKHVLTQHEIEMAGIEDQFGARASALLVSRAAGYWMASLDVQAIPCKMIHPSTWRAAFGLRSSQKRAALKQSAIEIAHELTGCKLTNDEADAVLIAACVARWL